MSEVGKMRGLKTIFLLALTLILIGVGLYFLRLPAAGWAVRASMSAAGLDRPQARVTALQFDHIRIEDMSAGSPGDEDVVLDVVEADFEWREAFRDRRVRTVRVGPGKLKASIGDDGSVSAAGLTGGAGDREASSGAWPFDRLEVVDLDLLLDTPGGVAIGVIDAEYDAETGGAASLSVEAANAGFGDWSFQQATLGAAIDLDPDGRVALSGNFGGDIHSGYGIIRDIALDVTGEGSSWTDLAAGAREGIAGFAVISLESAHVDSDDVAAMDLLNERFSAVIGGPLKTLKISGATRVSFQDGALAVDAGDAPIAAEGDTGFRISLDAAMGAPFYSRQEGRSSVAGFVSMRGGAFSAVANIDANESGDGWYFNMPIRMGALSTPALALSEMSAVVRGTAAAERADIEAVAMGELTKAAIGRLTISDAPLRAEFLATIDRSSQTATLRLPDGACSRLERLSLAIDEQNMAASLSDARLCGNGAPLAVIRFVNDPEADFAGDLSADHARYRLGETRLVGRPPNLKVTGRYEPVRNVTTAKIAARGGSARLNDLLRIDQTDAEIDFTLSGDGMTIDAEGKRLRLTEYADAPKIAPIMAAGTLTLAGDEARFDYRAATESGATLGAGSGVHNVADGNGNAEFRLNRLVFSSGSLQPDRLAPVLKGFIGDTVGAADGRAYFSWSRNDLQSSAMFSFDDVTFGGPGLTVTKTIGVNADIAFSSLWPIATDGAQSMTVRGVDFGALQLQDGEIIFDMPGDETLLVEQAIFPWFGGEIGVRDARASFAGGEALAPLRVESVDLKQILDYVDVEGLSGTGTLNGVLPLIVEEGRARIEGGQLTAEGPGRIQYVGQAASEAAASGGDAKIAFDVLRDLRYERLGVMVDGPLDGRLDFRINFEGTGEVNVNNQNVRMPVKYNVTLDAALLELLNQANLSRNLEMQIQRALDAEQ